MLRTIVLIAVSFASSAAIAKGGPHSSGPLTHVNGYTKADGTHVAGYDRAAPGYGTRHSATGMTGGGDPLGIKTADPNYVAAYTRTGKRDGGEPLGVDAAPLTPGLFGGPAQPRCEYKAVMTDDEIAACRAAATSAEESSRRRHK
jgi:hypothetical protein